MTEIASAVDRIYRAEAGRLHAYLLSKAGRDFQLAEDALHDAIGKAIKRWSIEGIPENPVGWLTITARNYAINELRKRALHSKNVEDLEYLLQFQKESRNPNTDTFPDERLRMIFTCCHPSLGIEAQVALTLRTVCGLTTDQIARSFLVATPTIAQRLVRAKRKIKIAGIPYRIPDKSQLPERVSSVLGVIYLVFNAGYEAERLLSSRVVSLSNEGISLARLLDKLLPNNPEILGLLALMLLHVSRRPARTDKKGSFVTLENQNRDLWDQKNIKEGLALVDKALRMGQIGEYQLQAAIAALHAQAKRPEQTDWPQIVALYKLLMTINPSPAIALNHAASVGMAETPDAGLLLLDQIPNRSALKTYHLLPAAYADLQRRAGTDPRSHRKLQVCIKINR